MQLPQTFPVSLIRARYADGEMPVVGANLGMVQALLRIGRPACKSKSKPARFLYQILCTICSSQDLAWEAPLESSRRRLGGLLEAFWRLPEPSWRPLESLGGLLGALGTVWEVSWELVGRPWRRRRAVLDASQAVMEPSWKP